ncbi:MAG TPA: serine hydrolase, partial [Pirellulales bacterium]|nr:serine hydrolase [Pirellulales bacterium]
SALAHAICLLFALAFVAVATAAPPKLPHASPEQAGMSSRKLDEIDAAVAAGIAEGQMPGCVALVARKGKVVFLKSYGHRSLEPDQVEMTTDTLFDLASLTKPIATATSIVLLVEQRRLALDDPIEKHWPEFGQQGKRQITVRQLLTHQGGLIADNAIEEYADGPEKALERIAAAAPQAEPGTRFIYSDVGFIVLGELVRRIAGQDLNVFAAENVFEPLGLAETAFLPPDELRGRAAPTERRDGVWMRGEVHDPRCFALGGVAGHAGLFSTAEDLAVYAQMLLSRGQYAGRRVLSSESNAALISPQELPGGGLRALGWDVRTCYSSNRGKGFSKAAFGHGGFTGTSLWIDPVLDLVVIFLSNRLHPDGKGNVNPLAGQIGTIAAAAILPPDDETPLANRLRPLIEAHHGRAAVAMKHLESGESFALDADDVFPTASLIKFPVLIELYRQAKERRVDLASRIMLREQDKVPGSGILTPHFTAGATFKLRDAARLMIAFSDNTATNLVLDRIGIASTGETMQQLGCENTRIHHKVYLRETTSIDPERSERYGLGSTTAAEMLRLLELLHQGKLVSEAASEAMLEHLKACDDKQKFPRFLPDATVVAFKTGSLADVRTAAGILFTPGGPLALVVLTAENDDHGWSADNAGDRLCAEIAREVYQHFNPLG